jgi:broad-specificity NMP kinase
MYGPPGTGKTTLTHFLAYHCGYEPVEINASDDRTGKSSNTIVFEGVEKRNYEITQRGEYLRKRGSKKIREYLSDSNIKKRGLFN